MCPVTLVRPTLLYCLTIPPKSFLNYTTNTRHLSQLWPKQVKLQSALLFLLFLNNVPLKVYNRNCSKIIRVEPLSGVVVLPTLYRWVRLFLCVFNVGFLLSCLILLIACFLSMHTGSKSKPGNKAHTKSLTPIFVSATSFPHISTLPCYFIFLQKKAKSSVFLFPLFLAQRVASCEWCPWDAFLLWRPSLGIVPCQLLTIFPSLFYVAAKWFW